MLLVHFPTYYSFELIDSSKLQNVFLNRSSRNINSYFLIQLLYMSMDIRIILLILGLNLLIIRTHLIDCWEKLNKRNKFLKYFILSIWFLPLLLHWFLIELFFVNPQFAVHIYRLLMYHESTRLKKELISKILFFSLRYLILL
jgi:hypothetical protein